MVGILNPLSEGTLLCSLTPRHAMVPSAEYNCSSALCSAELLSDQLTTLSPYCHDLDPRQLESLRESQSTKLLRADLVSTTVCHAGY
jgi:hypothetical protein